MRSQFEQVISIGKAVMPQVRGRGPVSIFDFTSQGRLQDARAVVTQLIESTQDLNALERAIDDVYVIGGQTTLLDAIMVINERFGATDTF